VAQSQPSGSSREEGCLETQKGVRKKGAAAEAATATIWLLETGKGLDKEKTKKREES